MTLGSSVQACADRVRTIVELIAIDGDDQWKDCQGELGDRIRLIAAISGARIAIDAGNPFRFREVIMRYQRVTSIGRRSRSLRHCHLLPKHAAGRGQKLSALRAHLTFGRNSEGNIFRMKVHNVLVVDDDDSTRNMLLAVLRLAGFAADAAASGDEALSRLGTTTYSAVVLDVLMPGMTGIEVMRRLASMGRHTKCVVLMSAGTESLLDDAPPALVHTKLRKPFNINDVVEAVRGCVEGLGTGEPPFNNYPGKGR